MEGIIILVIQYKIKLEHYNLLQLSLKLFIHDLSVCLTSDCLSPFKSLSRKWTMLPFKCSGLFYVARSLESTHTVSTIRYLYLFPLIKDRASFYLHLNFFLTHALNVHDCLCEYLSWFKLFSSPACICRARNTKTLSKYFMVVLISMSSDVSSEFLLKTLVHSHTSWSLQGWWSGAYRRKCILCTFHIGDRL